MSGVQKNTTVDGGKRRANIGRCMLRVIAVSLGAILVRSSVFHIENNYAFLSTIYSYQIVTPSLGFVMASVLPSLQLTLGMILLFAPPLWRIAFASSALLFLVYASAQTIVYARGLNIACGCFGSSVDNPIGVRSMTLVFTCLSMAIAGVALSYLRSQSAEFCVTRHQH